MKKLIIISNDKLYFDREKVYTDYNDTINILEGLSKNNYLNFISRQCKKKGIHAALIKNKSQVKISEIKKFDFKNTKIFMISITPFCFLVFALINFYHKDISGFVILRSDGFKEYYLKYGLIAKKLYGFFFKKILEKLKPITVSNSLENIKKYKYIKIYPSEITHVWRENLKKPNLSKAKLLYVGRIRKEKGIYSLIKLIDDLNIDYKLSIVGGLKSSGNNKKINFFNNTSNIKQIINFYDNNNIFILPSYTEGSPKVILESLSRLRPVIVFNEIKHVKSKLNGIFISKRNGKSLQKTIIHILKNYEIIQFQMKKNIIPTKENFQRKLISVVK